MYEFWTESKIANFRPPLPPLWLRNIWMFPYQRTNLWNFGEKILRIGDFEKWDFFESAILNFFFRKKKIFFCFILMKISPNLCGRMDGSKFWCFPWFSENFLLCVILRYTVCIWVSCILQIQKRTVSAETIRGNTVFSLPNL